MYSSIIVVVVQSLRLLATPWTAARQTSLSFTFSRSLLKLMSIELMIPSNHLILCCPLLLLPLIFPSIRVFSSESTLSIRWSKYWNFSFSISRFNEYSGLISLGLTGLISLLSKGLSRVFSSTAIRKHQLFSTQSSLWPNLNTYLIEIILKLFNHNLSPHSFFLQNQHKYIWLFLNLILDSLL